MSATTLRAPAPVVLETPAEIVAPPGTVDALIRILREEAWHLAGLQSLARMILSREAAAVERDRAYLAPLLAAACDADDPVAACRALLAALGAT